MNTMVELWGLRGGLVQAKTLNIDYLEIELDS